MCGKDDVSDGLRLKAAPKVEGPEPVAAAGIVDDVPEEIIEPNVPKPLLLPIPKDGCPNDVPPEAKIDDEAGPLPPPFPFPLTDAVLMGNKELLPLPVTLVEVFMGLPPPPPLISSPALKRLPRLGMELSSLIENPLLATVVGSEKMDGPDGSFPCSLSLPLSLSSFTAVTLVVPSFSLPDPVFASPSLSPTDKRSRPNDAEDDKDGLVDDGNTAVVLDGDASSLGGDAIDGLN